ncbi:MAG: enoyl-CoA hydratase/isomerase family protein [Novosphingobium sp.]|nr:enoyl-CoA hydratase/isomerase family protein [Novosphingobium sp.]
MTETATLPSLLTDVSEGIMTITFNRPERGNAWNPDIAARYFAALEEAATSPEVRAIVVTGAGKAFCTGGDGAKLDEIADSGDVRPTSNRPYWFPLQVGKPVIGAINGAAAGVGMQIALYTDVRIASDKARFSTFFARLGLVAEMGLSWMLPRLVGAARAADLLFSARMVGAEEALAMGMVNRVVPHDQLLDEARAYAKKLIETSSPWSMRIMKEQLYADLTSTVQQGYERAVNFADESVLRPDFREGLKALAEKRAPQFDALDPGIAYIDLAPPDA